jgi:FlaA1/EpsC-like NDP-sugar epimerase
MANIKFFFKKIFPRTSITRIIFFLVSDVIFIAFSVYLSFSLRFDGNIPNQYFPIIQKVIILAWIFCLPIFYFSKLYFFSWSYVSTAELISLFRATTLGFLFLGITLYISKDFPSFFGFPRSTLFISYFLVFLFCGGIRFAKRIYHQFFRGVKEEKSRTLIVGAGDAGEQILRSIQSSPKSPYFPIGFVDDNPIKQGVTIHGIRVLGKINDIPRLIKENETEEMIIALPSAGSKTIRRTVEIGRKVGLKKIKIVPSVNELINGEISIREIKEVEITDLLGREPIFLDTRLIGNFIQDKIVLITGVAGSIGSELARQVAKFKPSLLLILDQDETGIFNIANELEDKFPKLKFFTLIADICDGEKIDQIFEKFQPNIIFHAAAYKHVPLMEIHPDEAVKNNIFGIKIVAEAALSHRAEKFIFISTDKAVNPTSVMGATKRAGEMICQVLNKKNQTKFISVRFGNVLDSRGSVIPIFREQIKNGGPVEVTHPEMKRYFMITSEACLLVMQAGTIGQGGEVFVLDMGEPIKILDLAKEMIKLSGFEPDKDIPIVFTGVRPGEKFFEEILSAEEGTITTQNERIFIAKLSRIDENKLNQSLERLKEAVHNSDKEKIKTVFKELIPSYNPSISQN